MISEKPNVVQISIVIPTLNASAGLKRLLSSIASQNFHGTEVTVVDGGSTDDTVNVARIYGARVIPGFKMAQSRNIGAKAFPSRYLLFVDADMELLPGFLERCVDAIQGKDALCIREVVAAEDFWGRARGLEKAAYFGSGVYEAARFLTSDCFFRVGGYDEFPVNSVEDISLQAKILNRGLRVGWLDYPIVHHEEGLGIVQYLSKRKGRGFAPMAHAYPRYWKRFISPVGRLKCQLTYISGCFSIDNLTLFVALNLMRSFEYVLRAY